DHIPVLESVLGKQRFEDGALSTNVIAEEYPQGFSDKDLPAEDPTKLLAVATIVHNTYARRAAGISGQIAGRARKVPREWVIAVKDAEGDYSETPVRMESEVEGGTVLVGGREVDVTTDWVPGRPLFTAVVDGKPVTVQIDRKGIG